MNCIHQKTGLCPSCQAEADYDPSAWAEYGYHADGERRWAELKKELADDARDGGESVDDVDIPL